MIPWHNAYLSFLSPQTLHGKHIIRHNNAGPVFNRPIEEALGSWLFPVQLFTMNHISHIQSNTEKQGQSNMKRKRKKCLEEKKINGYCWIIFFYLTDDYWRTVHFNHEKNIIVILNIWGFANWGCRQLHNPEWQHTSTEGCIIAVGKTDCVTFKLHGGLFNHLCRPLPQQPWTLVEEFQAHWASD